MNKTVVERGDLVASNCYDNPTICTGNSWRPYVELTYGTFVLSIFKEKVRTITWLDLLKQNALYSGRYSVSYPGDKYANNLKI